MQSARASFDAGQWAEALQKLPHSMADERKALHALIRTQGDYDRTYAAVPKRLKVFLLSAYQSDLFNQIVDARLESLGSVFRGDLAMKHPGRSIFVVEDEVAEQPRADRFEISPTAPLFGFKVQLATGQQGKLEASILQKESLILEDFYVGDGIKARGERRSLRFQVHEPALWYDEGLMLRFWLQRGCYATALLAEIMKST